MNCPGTLKRKLAGKIFTSKKLTKVRTVLNIFGSTNIQKYEQKNYSRRWLVVVEKVKMNHTGGLNLYLCTLCS